MKGEKIKIRKNSFKKFKKPVYTIRPYKGLDTYVLDYEEVVNLEKENVVTFGKIGTFPEALSYMLLQEWGDKKNTIVGNGHFHIKEDNKLDINDCFFAIPLNGVNFFDKYQKENLIIDGIPFEFNLKKRPRIEKEKWEFYHPSFLDTYKNFCKINHVVDSMFNLEYGDRRMIRNPILSINPQIDINDFYENAAIFAFNIYSLIRYFQYRELKDNIIFDFYQNYDSSGLCILLAHPDYEYKIALPNQYPILGTELVLSDDFYKYFNLLYKTIYSKEYNELMMLFNIYGEIWELLIMKKYNLAITKFLGFFEKYYKCKRRNELINILASKIKINTFSQEQIKEKIKGLIVIRNSFVHDGVGGYSFNLNNGVITFTQLFKEQRPIVDFILQVFDFIICEKMEGKSYDK